MQKVGGVQITGTAHIVEAFSDEYDKLVEVRKIPKHVMETMKIQLHLIKLIPTEIDYLNTELRKSGYSSRQHIEL